MTGYLSTTFFLFICIVCAATIYDLLGKPIPIWLTVVGISIKAYELITYEPYNLREHIFTSTICAIILFGVAYFGNLGGADCLIGTLIVFQMGMYGIVALVVSFILAIPYAVYMKIKNKEKEYPFIPYMMAGALIVLIIKLKTGGFI